MTLEDIRWDRCDIKSIALLGNVLLRQEAADRGADEALLTRDGLLLEGSSSSVFLCVGGKLVTPPNSHRILPGTSRDAVLELARGLAALRDLRRRTRATSRAARRCGSPPPAAACCP